jgi:alcohol dehydrogenase (cytochrome c)
MLATGGGLVFTGKLTGEFLALDQDTGQQLWQFQTRSSINSTAITYTHKGRQYVTVASGLGRILARRAVGDKVPTGGSLWTFAVLPAQPSHTLRPPFPAGRTARSASIR